MRLISDASANYSDLIWKLVNRLHFKRTGDQNNLIHQWFSEIGQQTGEEAIDVKRRAKYDIGCVILCRDDPDFLAFCEKAMGQHKDRETRLEMMDYISVTSVMNTKQLKEFADTFERLHRANGYSLTMPQEKAA